MEINYLDTDMFKFKSLRRKQSPVGWFLGSLQQT